MEEQIVVYCQSKNYIRKSNNKKGNRVSPARTIWGLQPKHNTQHILVLVFEVFMIQIKFIVNAVFEIN